MKCICSRTLSWEGRVIPMVFSKVYWLLEECVSVCLCGFDFVRDSLSFAGGLDSCKPMNLLRSLNWSWLEDGRILACATVCWVVTLHAPMMPVPSSFRPWNIRPGRPCLSFCGDSVLPRRQHRRTECSMSCWFQSVANQTFSRGALLVRVIPRR